MPLYNMFKEADFCTTCLETITNPLCPTCFSKHVVLWLRDKEIPKSNLEKIKKELKRVILKSGSYHSDIKCVICDRKKVSLCTYCVTEKSKKIIEKNLDLKTNKSFKEDFDTTIWIV